MRQVAMGASTRGPASRSEKAVITVWLRSGVGGGGGRTGRGRGPPIGDEDDPDHKGHPLPGEEVEILSRKP